MNKFKFSCSALLLSALLVMPSCSQKAAVDNENSGEPITKGRDTELTYVLENPYEVEAIEAPADGKVKNVILMIGDGMSLAHVYTAWTANRGKLWLENAQATGLSKTYCTDKLITDSGAGGTALASGHKTKYHSVGVDPDGKPLKSLVDYAHEKGMSTGVNVTCRLWDATPADFLCHNSDRDQEDAIMTDYPTCNADVVVGPGWEKMIDRADGRDLLKECADNGFTVTRSLEEFEKSDATKAFCVPYEHDTPVPAERGNYLERAAMKTLDILSKNPNGFFLMIEGSQLDDYGHFNDIDLLMQETHDFDRTIGAVMKWAAKNGETLVVVTADHETGGLTLVDGDLNEGKVICKFSTGGHSGVMVPIYAFGPGAMNFTGIMENTDIPRKIGALVGLEIE